ncbi:hypothetical protein [Variovorax sp. 160MFSha2.1]|uniref:hypothetical protein n=1 Tax=Variovorax sp. 160MFSha2.1 TaxID=3158367 RepID=UPI003AB02936
MSIQKRKRDLDTLVERCGLELLQTSMTGQGHLKLTVRAPNGKTRAFAVASTPSDWRGEKNQEAEFKRFARDNQQLTTAVAEAMSNVLPLIRPEKVETEVPAPKQIETVERQMSHLEFYRLCEWLKTAGLDKQPYTIVEVIVKAQTALGFSMSEAQVREGLAIVGLTLTAPTVTQLQAVECMLAEMHRLMKGLGHVPSNDFLSLAQGNTKIE